MRIKTWSSQMIGVDVPLPGIWVFHRTFRVSLHSVGGVAEGETPLACGPRQAGQFAEGLPVAANTVLDARVKVARNDWSFMRANLFSKGTAEPVAGLLE